MQYTIETCIGRRTKIDAQSQTQAIARHEEILVKSWPNMIPSDLTVYVGREKIMVGPQEIIDAVAAEFGLESYNLENCA